ncbi:MAG: DUF4113 domain-containing protein [Chromatiaceae bacterium]|nr:DUF4113 domain-containing protein [Chromatiaceae bacterium]MBP8282863.1 DUF4113 domain-containing protein [Chromatiaceae bacterium]
MAPCAIWRRVGAQPWRMRRERLSPADTTQWEELLGVR